MIGGNYDWIKALFKWESCSWGTNKSSKGWIQVKTLLAFSL